MPQINRTFRNVAIILVIAALVDVVPGGGAASSTALEFIYLGFLGAFAWIASRLYREHRSMIYGLGQRRRTVAYVAAGVVALTLVGTDVLWNTGPAGNIAWLALLVGAGWALFEVFRSSRRY
ncbi:MAG TPA: hypothetical protein VFN48_00365 [Solirubrobacteraceae bacterium]|nr:hypothetical protein [Solirubrobacteraceae bacterium]